MRGLCADSLVKMHGRVRRHFAVDVDGMVDGLSGTHQCAKTANVPSHGKPRPPRRDIITFHAGASITRGFFAAVLCNVCTALLQPLQSDE